MNLWKKSMDTESFNNNNNKNRKYKELEMQKRNSWNNKTHTHTHTHTNKKTQHWKESTVETKILCEDLAPLNSRAGMPETKQPTCWGKSSTINQ